MKEALKLTLEALRMPSNYWNKTQFIKVKEAIAAAEEALANHIEDNLTMVAQLEQEPVATLDDLEQEIYENTRQFVSRDVMEWMLKRYYTTPPQRTEQVCCQKYDTCLEPCTPRGEHLAQRTWVGLTDEDIKAVNAQVSQIPPIDYTTTTYAKAIEAKLKEKNFS